MRKVVHILSPLRFTSNHLHSIFPSSSFPLSVFLSFFPPFLHSFFLHSFFLLPSCPYFSFSGRKSSETLKVLKVVSYNPGVASAASSGEATRIGGKRHPSVGDTSSWPTHTDAAPGYLLNSDYLDCNQAAPPKYCGHDSAHKAVLALQTQNGRIRYGC